MIYSALIGNPTDHSVSPLLFEWLSKSGPTPIDYRHIKITVDSESKLQDTFTALRALHFCGINVTLPYKLSVSPFLNYTDASAKKIGAINTVVFKDDETIGYNTDWYGIYAPLKQYYKGAPISNAVIFGSGGAARAAIYACLELGTGVITVIHRSPDSDRTKALKKQYKNNPTVQFVKYTEATTHINEADLIINATPTGMENQATTPLDFEALGDTSQFSDKVFFDCVFNPTHTPLLEYFAKNDAFIIDGLWMMIYQGLQAFSLWTGRDIVNTHSHATLSKLHELLEEELTHER